MARPLEAVARAAAVLCRPKRVQAARRLKREARADGIRAAESSAARVDAGSGEAVADFYMHLWKCFFACYALLPFVR